MPRVDLLDPMVQPYAWGSRTAIAELQGRQAPTAGPEAELWMGAHPSAPSGLDRGGVRTTLDAVVAADPAGELGAECAKRFGGRLPFLLKVLAAEKALSIQVHPSRAQAEAGFREETERGLLPGDKARNYVDDWPKPEILCALTPFEVLAGMRTAADAAELLRELGVGELEPVAADLAAAPVPEALTAALGRVLNWPAEGRAALVAAVVAACERLAATDSGYAAAAARSCGSAPSTPATLASWRRCCCGTRCCGQPRRCSCPPAACTPTCTASAWSSSRIRTTWCGRDLPASTSTCPSC